MRAAVDEAGYELVGRACTGPAHPALTGPCHRKALRRAVPDRPDTGLARPGTPFGVPTVETSRGRAHDRRDDLRLLRGPRREEAQPHGRRQRHGQLRDREGEGLLPHGVEVADLIATVVKTGYTAEQPPPPDAGAGSRTDAPAAPGDARPAPEPSLPRGSVSSSPPSSPRPSSCWR